MKTLNRNYAIAALLWIAVVSATFVLTGCAGLNTQWVLHMEYRTPTEAK